MTGWGDGIGEAHGRVVLAGRLTTSAVRFGRVEAHLWDVLGVDGSLTWVSVETLAGVAALSAGGAVIGVIGTFRRRLDGNHRQP